MHACTHREKGPADCCPEREHSGFLFPPFFPFLPGKFVCLSPLNPVYFQPISFNLFLAYVKMVG